MSTMKQHAVRVLAALAFGSFAVPTMAQSLTLPSTITTQQQQPETAIDDTPRANWDNANYAPPSQPKTKPKAEAKVDGLPPFGGNLFEGGFRAAMAQGLNPSYKVKPGDQITLRVWGAVEIDSVLTVDAQGNVFIPGIGPMAVQGQNSQQIDGTLRSAIRAVYPEEVQVYTNLQGVQPVGIYVTGYVKNPGRYAGTPSDSLLYFLDQAGGIDKDLGSYRQVRVVRNGRTVATVDLYNFLLLGEIARPQFRDGDTIVVQERGPAVAVTGDVHREYRYELIGDRLTGAKVSELARLNSGVSHVLLRGTRAQGPVAQYFTLDEFAKQQVQSGDEVTYSADQRGETIVVQIEGSYYGPSRYALPRDARLGELLDAIAVPKGMTAVESISIRRESVAIQQATALQDSLNRLETAYLGAQSSTNDEAQIRVREAELIQKFVERARQLKPSGRLVVAHDDRISDIRLQDGDVITIPEVSDSILISGEVVVPQAVVFKPGLSATDYIEGAGGFTQRADEGHILVVRQNGAVVNAKDVALRTGDEILVMPEVPTKNLPLATAISQILFQIAVATKVALDL